MTTTSFVRLAILALLAAPLPLAAQQDTAAEQTANDAVPPAGPTMAEVETAWQAGDFEFVRVALQQLANETGTPLAQYRFGRVLIEGRGGPVDVQGALDWLTRAAEAGQLDAATLLARMYLSNLPGLPRDAARAATLLDAPATAGQAEAQYYLGLLTASGDGVAPDLPAALALYQSAAEQRFIPAIMTLAQAYALGTGVAADQNEALTWLIRAAEAGSLDAVFTVAQAYDGGRGIEADPAKALQWYARAAEAGVTAAQRELGTRLLQGTGVAPDAEAGITWLTRAADDNDAIAQHNLGILYANGTGVEADLNRAALWLMRAVDGGFPRAKTALAQLFETGQGVPADMDRAITLYREATDAGEVPAARRLGQLAAVGVLDGKLAPQRTTPWVLLAAQAGDPGTEDWLIARSDESIPLAQAALAQLWLEQVAAARLADTEADADADALQAKTADAVALLQQAAQMGQRDAQAQLGQLLSTGDAGLDLDYVAAHSWFNLSAAGGHPEAAGLRDTIAGLMTPEQVAEAQTRARTFSGGPVPPDTEQSVTTSEGSQ